MLLWGSVIFRAAIVQVLPNERLSSIEKKQFNKTVTLNSRRGAIYDRSENELAVTVTSFSVYADPKIIKNRVKVSRNLAKILNIPSKKIFKKIKNKKKRFVWLKRRASSEIKDKIAKAQLKGISIIEEPKRIYPNGSLLAQTLGFVGSEEQGLEGLELKLDKELRGEKRKIRLNRDARGRPLLLSGQFFTDNKDGVDYSLTIDNELQYKLEAELVSTVNRFQADSAVGVIMDVDTSEVLSIANVPTFDVNNPFSAKAINRKNKSITDAFEPGSTMKTFVLAGAIASGQFKPSSKVDCEDGKFKIGKHYIRESDAHHKFGLISLSEVLAKSSNVGTAKVALKLGAKKTRSILKDFGFGKKTNIGFPGESSGVLHKTPWRKHLLSNVSFGHGMTATPLQIAAAYTSIANGGLLKKPVLVKSSYNHSTGEKKEFSSELVRRVLTKEDAATMRLMLMGTTTKNGTGFNARIHGFPVAGKTGTAQKVSAKGGYEKGAYVASFAGFVPANNPKYVIYIAVDNPRLKYYGSEVAAPVFAKVASYAVLKEGLPPVLLSEEDIIDKKQNEIKLKQKIALKKININGDKKIKRVPILSGLSLRQVYQRVSGQDLKIKVNGSGRVVKTWPEAGTNLGKNRSIKVKLSN